MRSAYTSTVLAVIGLLLGIHEGCIALWQEGADEPLQVYPCQVSMLPIEDQSQLQAGIPIENESRLHRLLEDYLS